MDTRSKEILDDEEEDLDQYSEFHECQTGIDPIETIFLPENVKKEIWEEGKNSETPLNAGTKLNNDSPKVYYNFPSYEVSFQDI
ncbi:hypothetical protein Avbf_07338 [Armadillidium vulgare]|nr:hypothetical protein Avbf_07338 [Armadillidium vulgare]